MFTTTSASKRSVLKPWSAAVCGEAHLHLTQRKTKIWENPKNRDLIDKYKGNCIFSPKTWNHPTVIAVILGWAVCSKHSLKIEFGQKLFFVNVRVFWLNVRASSPKHVKVPDPKWCHWTPLSNETTQTHFPIINQLIVLDLRITIFLFATLRKHLLSSFSNY